MNIIELKIKLFIYCINDKENVTNSSKNCCIICRDNKDNVFWNMRGTILLKYSIIPLLLFLLLTSFTAT